MVGDTRAGYPKLVSGHGRAGPGSAAGCRPRRRWTKGSAPAASWAATYVRRSAPSAARILAQIAHLDLDGLTLFLGCKPAAEHRLTVEQVEHAAEVAEKVFPTRDLVR